MTAKITIDVPPSDRFAVRVGIEHDNSRDIEITHVAPGTSWTGYVFPGTRIVEISEVKISEVQIGRTHTGKYGAPVSIDDQINRARLVQSAG